MATVRTRRTAATLDQLLIRVRRAVGDIVDDAAPGMGNRKWEDTPIVDAINDMIAEMLVETNSVASTMLIETAVTYIGGATSYSLGADADAMNIYALFEVRGSKRILLRYVAYPDSERFRVPGEEVNGSLLYERFWSRLDNGILLRPIPAADVSLVIVSLGAPFAMSVASPTDNHPLPIAHEELLVLGAANRLQYPNDQLPIGRQAHYSKLWMKWQQECDRYGGPRYPASDRRYRSS